MKVLLFVPQFYSLAEMLKDGFEANGWEAQIVDYVNLLPHWQNRLYERTAGLPNRVTKYWKPEYFRAINKRYLELVNSEKPELILIYNNQYFFPETIAKIKEKCKVVFFLGDNPLWSSTFVYNLEILKYSDFTVCPDTHWQFELTSIGMPNVVCDHIGYSSKLFFQCSNIPKDIQEKYKSNILFIGRNYADASGYKRSLFLNSFAGKNMKVFGTKDWLKWFPQFPELANHFHLMEGRISNTELNQAINCCKVYPVDQNTGIINGIHLRVFEIIGAGVLPVVEWRKDIDTIFGGILPTVKSYGEVGDLVDFYLDHEAERIETVERLRNHLKNSYTPALYVNRLIHYLH